MLFDVSKLQIPDPLCISDHAHNFRLIKIKLYTLFQRSSTKSEGHKSLDIDVQYIAEFY